MKGDTVDVFPGICRCGLSDTMFFGDEHRRDRTSSTRQPAIRSRITTA
ncbi:MAG: hypothetical protein MZU84_01075 [Sphingobacterium sp.]|nr:hypothetical protein [Sphingobacterium sp.]